MWRERLRAGEITCQLLRELEREIRRSVDNMSKKSNYLAVMSEEILELQQRVAEFARSTEVAKESFLMRRFLLDDEEQVQKVIDGLTLALISYCYHHHPRGENVHELMEQLEQVEPNSAAAKELESRADDAAALQIPFIVTLNGLVEDYYEIRKQLESCLAK